MIRKEPLHVSIVVDVEEEGLFTGNYPRKCTVENIAHLPSLAPISEECGIPLTLVCAHPVLTDAKSCHILERMRRDYGAEIGVHLHYWSTPPYSKEELAHDYMSHYVEAKDVNRELLEEKFQCIFKAAADFCGHPVTTFRMGRWDMSRELWPIFAKSGITVDSSIRPWQYPKHWRDHFHSPTMPYKLQVGDKTIVEIPDTSVPLVPIKPSVMRAMYNAPKMLKHSWHQTLVMLPSPVHHNLAYMQAAALVMLARGDKVLNLTWHSTEIAPGKTPHVPDQKSADLVIERTRKFLHWLAKLVPVRGRTLSQLASEQDFAIPHLEPYHYELPGDWHP